MEDFLAWSNNNNLMELPSKDSFFTWYNGREGRAVVMRKLDRSFCNVDWSNVDSNMVSLVLPIFRSDHHPLLVISSFNQVKLKSQFKFLVIWTLHNSYRAFVEDSWYVRIMGCPMFIMSRKLQILKDKLKN